MNTEDLSMKLEINTVLEKAFYKHIAGFKTPSLQEHLGVHVDLFKDLQLSADCKEPREPPLAQSDNSPPRYAHLHILS